MSNNTFFTFFFFPIHVLYPCPCYSPKAISLHCAVTQLLKTVFDRACTGGKHITDWWQIQFHINEVHLDLQRLKNQNQTSNSSVQSWLITNITTWSRILAWGPCCASRLHLQILITERPLVMKSWSTVSKESHKCPRLPSPCLFIPL